MEAAASPPAVSQSPQTPTREVGSRMQGTLGELMGRAAPHSWHLGVGKVVTIGVRMERREDR